jgi:hypothetical protein
MRIVSPQITLNPGIEAESKKLTTATVRLLTRAERNTLMQIADLEKQNEEAFVQQIESIGGETDREKISQYVSLLTWPDEERLNGAMTDLATNFRDARFLKSGHTCPQCGAAIACEGSAAATG